MLINKQLLLVAFLLIISGCQTGTPDGKTFLSVNTKLLDNGGSGLYPAIATSEASLPEFVVYRPDNLKKARAGGNLPVLIFANGGCNDTSFPYERALSEIASHGYIVIALGAMQRSLDDRPLKKTTNSMMIQAIDWISVQNNKPSSAYLDNVSTDDIAIGGQSCGGAQVLAVASDPRIKTYLMFNSGIGDMSMAQATKASLTQLHKPILYLVGGPSDVATANAELDYQRINHVPVAFANHLTAGHSGTYEEPYGGSFARMAVTWLDWQLKNKPANAKVFLRNQLDMFPGWTMKAKHF